MQPGAIVVELSRDRISSLYPLGATHSRPPVVGLEYDSFYPRMDSMDQKYKTRCFVWVVFDPIISYRIFRGKVYIICWTLGVLYPESST